MAAATAPLAMVRVAILTLALQPTLRNRCRNSPESMKPLLLKITLTDKSNASGTSSGTGTTKLWIQGRKSGFSSPPPPPQTCARMAGAGAGLCALVLSVIACIAHASLSSVAPSRFLSPFSSRSPSTPVTPHFPGDSAQPVFSRAEVPRRTLLRIRGGSDDSAGDLALNAIQSPRMGERATMLPEGIDQASYNELVSSCAASAVTSDGLVQSLRTVRLMQVRSPCAPGLPSPVPTKRVVLPVFGRDSEPRNLLVAAPNLRSQCRRSDSLPWA